MRKSKQIFLNILTICLLNGAFWVCNSYPKQILTSSWIGSALNLLFFIAYFFVLIIIFCKNKSIFSKNIFDVTQSFGKRFHLKKLFILVAIQLLFLMVPISTFGAWGFIIADASILLNWVLIYIILHSKGEGICVKKNLFLVFIILLALILSVCLAGDIGIITKYLHLSDKYEITSSYAWNLKQNLNFIHSHISMILDCSIGVILIIFHTLGTKSDEEASESNTHNSTPAFLLRIFILLISSSLLLGVRMIIYPVSYLISGEIYTIGQSSDYCENEFHETTETTTLYRMNNLRSLQVEYQSTETEIYYYKTKTADFSCYDLNPAYTFTISNDQIHINSNSVFQEYTIDGNAVLVYHNSAVCFVENDIPRTVLFEEITGCEENKLVIEVCKKLMTEGNLIVFEYCCDYLLKYDSAFIEPYINRYANGDFTQIENAVLDQLCYRDEYIVALAQSYLRERSNGT